MISITGIHSETYRLHHLQLTHGLGFGENMDGILLIHPTTPVTLAAGSFIFLIFAAYYARPWLAGMIGASRIQRQLKVLQKKGATVMNHIQLTTKQGDALHIDHLIITNEQIFIISHSVIQVRFWAPSEPLRGHRKLHKGAIASLIQSGIMKW